ncbi:SPOR domain-containing protein [Aurantiacibacter sediminis]|uniref:SPOR domain-containing protein n=1 Tax=Aurantiacibacter sediminis TaxID=2793064 RepID=A0ABS0N6F8_9SPHN|nr:SPOR domain-containing protein [Aurantiacibacter sediminis]MBH5323337.1 SPOR domain-containing protein [Aurantiacibacter sediminis]
MTYQGDENETGDESLEQEEQLALADEDEDLPWLEGDDYEDEGGFDFRLIGIAVVGLLVVAAALFGVWWFTKDTPDAELIADGSTIEAPEGAYKQRPEDPGGRDVSGTGDQAFQVAEGESTRGRIEASDGGDSNARPSIDRNQDGVSGSRGETEATGGAYVQIGAFGSRSDAQTAWSSASNRFSALSGLRYRIVEAEVNGADVFRLQAVASDRSAADSVCRSIRASGGDCYVR